MVCMRNILFVFTAFLSVTSFASGEFNEYNLEEISIMHAYPGFTRIDKLNNNGQVVGYGTNSSSEYRSMIWDSINGSRDIGWGGIAASINDYGHILSGNGTGVQIYDLMGNLIENQEKPYPWRGHDINNHDHVTGTYVDAAYNRYAYVWDSVSGFQTLTSGEFGTGVAINDSGYVVGWNEDNPTKDEAFLWTPQDGIISLGTLCGDDDYYHSYANDINNANQIVGKSDASPSNIYEHAFIWDEINNMRDLGSLSRNSTASAINDLGLVIGKSYDYDSPSVGFIWSEADGMVSISDLLTFSYSGYNILDAYDINNHNQIVALAELDGEQYYVLLTPVPEPTSILFFLAGSMAFLRKKGGYVEN